MGTPKKLKTQRSTIETPSGTWEITTSMDMKKVPKKSVAKNKVKIKDKKKTVTFAWNESIDKDNFIRSHCGRLMEINEYVASCRELLSRQVDDTCRVAAMALGKIREDISDIYRAIYDKVTPKNNA